MGHKFPEELFTGMREQQKSKLPKKGEGTIHFKAKERLVKALEDRGWCVYPDAKFTVYWEFENQFGNRIKEEATIIQWDDPTYYHEFDIWANKKHDNGLTSELIVEIDGSSHNSKIQQGKDKTAEDYAAFFLPDARFVRLDIAMLLNYSISDQSICNLYNIK